MKLNKFEKKFIIVDIISQGCLLGAFLFTLIQQGFGTSVIVIILVYFYYTLRLRKKVWNNLESQEKLWLAMPKTKSPIEYTDKVRGQWDKTK